MAFDERRHAALQRKEALGETFQGIADATSYAKTTVIYVLHDKETPLGIDREAVLDEVEAALDGVTE